MSAISFAHTSKSTATFRVAVVLQVQRTRTCTRTRNLVQVHRGRRQHNLAVVGQVRDRAAVVGQVHPGRRAVVGQVHPGHNLAVVGRKPAVVLVAVEVEMEPGNVRAEAWRRGKSLRGKGSRPQITTKGETAATSPPHTCMRVESELLCHSRFFHPLSTSLTENFLLTTSEIHEERTYTSHYLFDLRLLLLL